MKHFLILLALCFTFPALAQVAAEGRGYSDSGCSYDYSTLADFKITYQASSLKPVKSVDFIVGFHNTWGQKDWASVRSIQAEKEQNSSWVVNLNSVVISKKGSFSFDTVEWIVQINNLDGTTILYRPLGVNSFFKSSITSLPLSCQKEEFVNLDVQAAE